MSDARAESIPLSVMDAAPSGLILFGPDWRYRYVNPAAARQLGTTPEALHGRIIWEVFPDAVGGPFWDQLHEAQRTGTAATVESFYAPLGRWYRVNAFRTADGGVAVHFTDTTDAQRLLEEVQRSRRDLAEAQRIARVGNWEWDVASGDVRWSEETYRVFGLDASFAPSFERLRAVVHPADWSRMTRALEEALAGRAPYDIDLRILRGDGETLDVHVTGEVLRAADGRATGMFGTVQDVTLVRKADRALLESRQLLARVSRIAGIAAWTYDVATGAIVWEPENWPLWGLDPAAFVPTPESFLALVLEEDRPRFVAVLEAIATATGDYAFDTAFRARHGSGELRHYRAVGELLRDPDTGRPLKLLGLTIDDTEQVRSAEARRQMDVKLQQAQRLESLGVLAGGIAHDFNNLLVGILGNASLALSDLPPGEPLRESLLGIEIAAQRAADLTRQLLAYSGRGRFVIERLDLTRLVEEMSRLLGAALSKKAELRLSLTPGLPPIDADATQVRQVVMNLLTNASEAIGDRPGEIVVRTGRQRVDADYAERTVDGATITPGDYVFLEVADSGDGIPARDIVRIFEPFYTTKFTGRGLGLAATLGIVRGHRGGIKVYSEVGRGTTFKVLFPAVDGVADAPREESTLGRFTATGAVLVVDDEHSVRDVARAMLARRGFEVLEAANGEEALDLFAHAHDRVRVVLLDLTMPRLDGEEVFRRLRAIAPGVRVIMMSGYNEQNVTQRFVGKGLAGFLQKPFRSQELFTRIAEVLRDAH